MEQIPPFYIGQRVVRLESTNDGTLKKGEEFIVKGIKFCCSAIGWRIDVGRFPENYKSYACSSCHKQYEEPCIWIASKFAPLEENTEFQAITFTKILEKELVSIN